MERIDLDKELSLYNLAGKWNDCVAVQKEVIQVLRREGFFDRYEVINRKTGLRVKLNAKGIKETLGTATSPCLRN